jgi:hypothetical protein
MTPEERSRADAINDAIATSVKSRGQPFIPGVSPEPVAESGNSFKYAVVFVFVAAVHVGGFFAYRHYTESKAREQEQAQRQADMQAEAIRLAQEAAENARAEVARLRREATRPVSPKIEYNIYPDPVRPSPTPQRPAPRPAPVVARPQPARVQPPQDLRPLHQSAALNYLRSKKSDTWNARVISTQQVPGWDGRYRTEFEIPRGSYSNTSLPRPRRYEVLTQETDGVIAGIDVTTKGY